VDFCSGARAAASRLRARQARVTRIVWNLACDCVVNEFLVRMKIGLAPEGLLRLPPGSPTMRRSSLPLVAERQPPSGQTTKRRGHGHGAGRYWENRLGGHFRPSHPPRCPPGAQYRRGRRGGTIAGPASARLVRGNYPLLGAVLQHFRMWKMRGFVNAWACAWLRSIPAAGIAAQSRLGHERRRAALRAGTFWLCHPRLLHLARRKAVILSCGTPLRLLPQWLAGASAVAVQALPGAQ